MSIICLFVNRFPWNLHQSFLFEKIFHGRCTIIQCCLCPLKPLKTFYLSFCLFFSNKDLLCFEQKFPLVRSPFRSILSQIHMSRLMTKPTKWHVRPAKTQISLGIRPVWSESSLCAQWVAKDSSFLHADSEDSGWSESSLGAHAILLVLSWGGSYVCARVTAKHFCWTMQNSSICLEFIPANAHLKWCCVC